MELENVRELVKTRPPAMKLRVIGVDEVPVRKGHTYRVVVVDLDEKRPIWIGSTGRTEEDMDLFFAEIGAERSKTMNLAVMGMWKVF